MFIVDRAVVLRGGFACVICPLSNAVVNISWDFTVSTQWGDWSCAGELLLELLQFPTNNGTTCFVENLHQGGVDICREHDCERPFIILGNSANPIFNPSMQAFFQKTTTPSVRWSYRAQAFSDLPHDTDDCLVAGGPFIMPSNDLEGSACSSDNWSMVEHSPTISEIVSVSY